MITARFQGGPLDNTEKEIPRFLDEYRIPIRTLFDPVSRYIYYYSHYYVRRGNRILVENPKDHLLEERHSYVYDGVEIVKRHEVDSFARGVAISRCVL